MLKQLSLKLGVGVHGPIPPNRFWGYYTGPEIGELARDPDATVVLQVGAVEQHGPHLPTVTDTLNGVHVLGAALERLPDDVVVLALPPTNLGKSEEHRDFAGTLSLRGETVRMLLLDIATSVARSGFEKLVLFNSHGGNVGAIDDFFRDLRIETGMRIFKIHGGIGNVPGLISPEESAIAMHAGDAETSMVRYLAPQLVEMERAEGYVYETHPLVGYSFKGNEVIEAWVTPDLAPTGAIGNPHLSSPEKGQALFEAGAARLAELLEAVYRLPPREVRKAAAPALAHRT
ncbi:MAG: creatininase family protein [Chloroflexi bacterium]|nr:creatininase family protein [Chloroflexota bacterium]MBV9895306.1 creatininase family protein [Chloroflexota bacterium]